jgi:hypothetical protein
MLKSSRVAYTRIRNVHRVRRLLTDGRTKYHFYHRKTRDKLPGQPGSPEFMAAYQECECRLTPRAQSIETSLTWPVRWQR